ncbi:apoptotic chromatin condensation inducer in the nucleus-like, partial [Aphelocoma coerulescens]|uniref:apoptotic chromatin condensation inducer in the nucleus-like n=1 Tax=Aphelocoma coerulescens TaxID=39617 RepID=UPI003604FE58
MGVSYDVIAPPPPPPPPVSGEAPPPRRSQGAPWRAGPLLLLPVDEPVRAAPRPSPPRQRPSPIVHLCNLVRPFTLGQLKELLGRTGRLKDDGFWIDRIKSHCFVTYCSVEEAVATREALHGVKWPQSNPKVLAADFAQQEELDFHRGLLPSPAPDASSCCPSPHLPPSSSSR